MEAINLQRLCPGILNKLEEVAITQTCIGSSVFVFYNRLLIEECALSKTT